jgi:hypothetical protein
MSIRHFVALAAIGLCITLWSCDSADEPSAVANLGDVHAERATAADEATWRFEPSYLDRQPGTFGYLEHRGTRHALVDVADPQSRAQSEDSWLKSFQFDSATATVESGTFVIPETFEPLGTSTPLTPFAP